ncbi:glycerol kinase GlpK [Mycobacteroides saopaulense]|uniref:ATP:glycerol 3-phosphotransferase n=1 Tax=Mycobacteroides saopaulense TaxID=1578165 RepID=A0ABX3C0F3_9MYCO|nr:glycerol kinase GlpK [Mycobacteroides saopaulense]OHT83216.1 glycerol kinase [Mycobacteroides saopaulense]OHU09918.1 glycerol kinase [Mycobacteroides saopaulense]
MTRYVAAIDQGTTSTRCILFDHDGQLVSVAQYEHRQHHPRPGWVEHDASEIWRTTKRVLEESISTADAESADIAALGITNQRESTVLWDRETGRPVARSIVWTDARTETLVRQLASEHGDRVRELSGLSFETYFSGPKIRWLLDSDPALKARAHAGELMFGTMDTWVAWNLTGGADGGAHVTDVTNASRTMLMDLRTLQWSDELLSIMDIPRSLLPEIRPCVGDFGQTRTVAPGIPIGAMIGDQQAALFGHTCFLPGEGKCTLGTGGFVLLNTGDTPVCSGNGMVTTVGYQIRDEPPVYALEGSIATTGSLVQWLRDGLGLISVPSEVETLALSVPDNGGCYIVPAFYGMFAPYWEPAARGVIAGLTAYVTKGHLARAVLEATAWQVHDVIDVMQVDAEVSLSSLQVDGGMTANNLLMQTLADVVDVPILRTTVAETVSLGAAYAAGLSVGFWKDKEELRRHGHRAGQWTPRLAADTRATELANWRLAVNNTLNWNTASPRVT